jgi:hypothetical protein
MEIRQHLHLEGSDPVEDGSEMTQQQLDPQGIASEAEFQATLSEADEVIEESLLRQAGYDYERTQKILAFRSLNEG